MKVLLTNDDGATAQGLAILHQQLHTLAECVVVAPDRDCSGASCSITLDRPLHVTEQANGFLSVNGTPADCVHLAANALMAERPVRVIAGINRGANLGDDVLYSGTVAAALEGRFMAKTAVAISACGEDDEALITAGQFARTLFAHLHDLVLPPGTVLNINVPACGFDAIRGIKITRLGHRARPAPPKQVTDPRGKTAYWFPSSAGEAQDAQLGTDFHAIAHNFVSITPLQYDKTHHGMLSLLEEWLAVVWQAPDSVVNSKAPLR